MSLKAMLMKTALKSFLKKVSGILLRLVKKLVGRTTNLPFSKKQQEITGNLRMAAMYRLKKRMSDGKLTGITLVFNCKL